MALEAFVARERLDEDVEQEDHGRDEEHNDADEYHGLFDIVAAAVAVIAREYAHKVGRAVRGRASEGRTRAMGASGRTRGREHSRINHELIN